MKSDPRAAALATAVATRDQAALGVQLTEDIRLRALLPGGPIEENGRDAVLATFDRWFGSYDTVVLEDAAGELVGDRLLVHYRLVFEPEVQRRALTQTWVSTVAADGRLARIDLLCSGFRKF